MLLSRYKDIPMTKSVVKKKSSNPMLFLIKAYAVLIVLGTILLKCPFSLEKDLSVIDAFFTATSAVCVTGLSVIDIGTVLSPTGLWILAALIQIGGLGIMTFSTAILLLSGIRPGFNQQALFKSGFTSQDDIEPKKILIAILPFTFVIEGLGTTALFTQFDHLPMDQRILYSVFHSISAFCNAGFSPFANSLCDYQFNHVVNIVTMLMVVAGGIGFLSMSEIKNLFDFHTRTIQKISLHTKIILLTTAIISIVELLFVLLLEWNGALAGLDFGEKLISGLFISFSSRTAGFNTFDMLTLRETTIIIIIISMFIGASPGSCGGGIKTSTAAVIAILGFNRLLGREKTQVLNRTIPEETVSKSVRIFIVYIVLSLVGTLILLLTEYPGASAGSSESHLLYVFFEVTSALSTCGLSLGLTPELSSFGRIFICIFMFVGRMGALLLISAVVKKRETGAWYAEEDIMVG
ncbi:MAG: potassium transporter TrkG [Hallerella porci]|uniref:Trk system potassium uptake protein TrkH n=1 Tax=Hallerella porci TaxID=1945871 RepID=A0ABX5LKM4_9BACT|nr:potassium transporter TrkG [Hallerella porci]MDY3922016.1 potassium transporter TrkG [Hallerella porci]PWL01170.1 trk system potassium uptake protein TrkH [Hallerella porci]